ncbi:MAG TPA: hypothetical protein DCR04_07275 [Flavobacteriales bacterium]|nr:hypothetical protein [Flavobacteriales bacterium]
MRVVRVFSVVVLMSILAVSAQAQKRPKDKLLDRAKFVVTMSDQSDKKKTQEPFEEELSFRNNRMSTRQMRTPDRGSFQMGDYAISKVEKIMDDAVYHFQAINRSPKGISLKWEGKVMGSRIEGKATVSKKGKIKEEYIFSGEKKEK